MTGAGGPSGISILRAMAGEPVELLAADIDPYAAGLYLVPPDRRAILPRGDDPAFADGAARARAAASRVAVVVPTVDSELLPVAAAPRRVRRRRRRPLVVAAAETLSVCLDKWALDACCRDHVRVPRTVLADEGVRSGSRSTYR